MRGVRFQRWERTKSEFSIRRKVEEVFGEWLDMAEKIFGDSMVDYVENPPIFACFIERE